MSIFLQAVILGVTLAMDAFSISVSKALASDKIRLKNGWILGGTFGIFQAVMPIIGYLVGSGFYNLIKDYFNIVSFIILAFIGTKMIIECRKDEEKDGNVSISLKELMILGVATSIDALAAGFVFSGNAFVTVLISCLIIGAITFIICFVGYLFGAKVGTLIGDKGEAIGGIVLILLGLKFLLDFFI